MFVCLKQIVVCVVYKEVGNLYVQLLILNKKIYLSREASVADGAFEWSLFSVTAVMDFQRRIAGESLVADSTCCISAHCTQINRLFIATIKNTTQIR